MSDGRNDKNSGDTYSSNEREQGAPLLIGNNGEPLRLFTQSGKPVTDWFGRPLYNICGKILAVCNLKQKQFEDIRGNPLTDASGKQPLELGFNPVKCPENDSRTKALLDSHHKPLLVYDIKGDPLTNDSGFPLADRNGHLLLVFDSRGNPVCDRDGKKIINKFGESINDLRKLPLLSASGEPLQVYDRYRKPLTCKNGCPLLDIKGDLLIVNDKTGNPLMTSYGSGLYNAEGIRFPKGTFDLTKTTIIKQPSLQMNETGETKLVFDRMGCPLTDYEGESLTDSRSKPLIILNEENGKIIDYLGNDVNIILKSNYESSKFRSVKNSLGVPARLFNRHGKPLTNLRGEPLTNACGNLLLRFDLEGYPCSDWEGGMIYDEFGVPLGCLTFNPFGPVEEWGEVTSLAQRDEEPLILFNKWGFPVTDARGFPLFDARRNPLVKFKNLPFENKYYPVDASRETTLYEACGLPLIDNYDKPIQGPKGFPARLFDSYGNPLTDSHGYILKFIYGEYLVKSDRFGRIISDCKGGMIYDSDMNPKRLYLEFNCDKVPQRESGNDESINSFEKQLYNFKGFPLTDCRGTVLVNCNGQLLMGTNNTQREESAIYDLEGSVYDIKQIKQIKVKYALFNKDRRPLTDKRGNVLRNRTGKLLVRLHNGVPITDLYFGKLYDICGRVINHQSPVIKESRVENNNSTLRFECQLFDSDDLPLLDRLGYILYTSDGSPLIKLNKERRIVCDFKGKPIFDQHGIPMTKKSTSWVDQSGKPLRLFDHNKLPLTDSNGKELQDINGKSVIQLDGLGRPVMDRWNNAVYDALGIPITDVKFQGSTPVHSVYSFDVLEEETSKPIRLFDRTGRPLTDDAGHSLLYSDGRVVIEMPDWMSIVDYSGCRPFDARKLPLGCTRDKPLISMNGKPLRLFDREKLPLTNERGFPLALANDVPLIVFDRYGRPVSGPGNGELYDRRGRAAGEEDFEPDGCSPTPEPPLVQNRLLAPPFRLFDFRGRPLTDNKGRFLVDADGTVLVRMDAYRNRVYNEYAELVPFQMSI